MKHTFQERAEILVKELDAKDINQVDIAKAAGVTKGAVSQWLTGGIKSIKLEYALGIQNAYGYNHRWLVMGELPKMINEAPSDVSEPIAIHKRKNVPLVGEVMGGSDGYLEEFGYPVGHGEGEVEYPTNDPNAYALRVRGDSMHPRYRAGEFVIVEPNIEPQEGDDVVVICGDGRKMLKQLNWRRDDSVQFLSINNGYGPLTLKKKEVSSMQLVGGRARSSALRKS